MSDPTSGGNLPPHTTTIEISGNGQVNAAFEDTEGGPRTPPPPRETSHMNGETKSNGEAKQQNGVELRTPGSEGLKDSEMAEAVNLELVNMQPSYTNSIPIKKESTQLDIGDPYDEYFVPVNQHKKYMRGEKLYVTQDKRRTLGGSSKKCCWGLITVIVLGAIVAILIGVILTSQEEAPLEESRTFNGHKASIGGAIVPTPPPSSTAQPPRPTTDMTEMILDHVLEGELTIDNLEFTPGLADKNSSEFKNLASSLEEELKPALFDHQTLRYGAAEITVKVLEFKSGSVVVSYRVGWEFKTGLQNPPDPIDKDSLKTRLQEHLRNNDGFLYNYRLPLHTLKSENVMNVCQLDNGGCDHICSFNSTSLQFACSCEDSYTLESDSKTCIKTDVAESSNEHEPSPEPEPSAEPEPSSEHEPEPTVVHEPSSGTSVEHETEPISKHEPTAEPIPSEHEPEPSTEPKPASESTLEHATEPSLEHEHEPKPSSEYEPEPSSEPRPASESTLEHATEPSLGHEPEPKPFSEHEPEPSSETKPASESTLEHATEPSFGHEPEPKPFSEHEPEPSSEPKPASESTLEHATEPFFGHEPEPSGEIKPSSESPTSQKMETDASPEPTVLPPHDSETSEPSSQQERFHQIGVLLEQEHSEVPTEAHSSSTKDSLTESATEAEISKHSMGVENIGGSTSNLPSQENTLPEMTSHPEETTMPEMKSEDPSKPLQDITTPGSSSSSHMIAEHEIFLGISEEPESRSEQEINTHLSENLAQGHLNETSVSSEEISHMSSSTESEDTGSSESPSPSVQNVTSSITPENIETSSSSTESVEAGSLNSVHSLVDIPKETRNKSDELINTEVPLEMRHRVFPTTIGSQKSQSTTESSESTLLNEFDGEFPFGKTPIEESPKDTNEPTTMTDSHAPTTLGNIESQTEIPQKIVDPMTMNEHEPASNASMTDSTEIHLGVDVHSSSTSEEMSLSSDKNISPTESFMTEAKPFADSKTKTDKIEPDDLSSTEIYNMVTESPTLNTEMIQKSTEKGAMPMEITQEKVSTMPEAIEVGTIVHEPVIKPTINSTVDNVTSHLGLNSEIKQNSEITTEINPQEESELTTIAVEKENATTQSSDTSKSTSEKQINEVSSEKPNGEPKMDAATSSSTNVEKQIITTDNNTNAAMSVEKSENEATTLKNLEESMTFMTQIPDLSGPFSVDSILLPPSDDDIREENSKVVDPLVPNVEESQQNNADENDSKNWYDAKNDLNSLDDDYNEEENHKYYKEKNSNFKEKHYKNFKIEEIGSPHDSDAVEQKHSHRIHEAPFVNMSNEATVNETSTESNKEITTGVPVSSSSTSESPPSTDRQERNRKELEVENKTNIPGESSSITVSGITYKPLLNEDSTVAITTIDDTEATTIKNLKVTTNSNKLVDVSGTQLVSSENLTEINKETILTSTPEQEMEINKNMNDSDPHYVIYLDPSNVTDGVPASTESHSIPEVNPEMSAKNESLPEKPAEMKIVEMSTAPSVSETEKLLAQENPIIFEQNGSTTSRPEVMSPSSDQSLQRTSEIIATTITSKHDNIGIQSSSSSPLPVESNIASSEANLQLSSTEKTAEIQNQEKNATLEIGVSAVDLEPQTEVLNSNLTSKLNLTLLPYPYMNTTLLDRMNMSSKCASGQFACADGSGCLRSIQRCDSVSDCNDGSDEMHCQEEGCPGNFQCESGQCLKRYHVCNSKKDCPDGSDELNCEKWQCKFDELRCSTGECIPILWKCDGKPDCPGNTDEHNCKDSCNNDEFLCPEGWCIPLSQKCDGIRQCTNGEDELECSP